MYLKTHFGICKQLHWNKIDAVPLKSIKLGWHKVGEQSQSKR